MKDRLPKRDPSWDKKPFIGGGTTEPAEHGIGGGSSGATIPGGNVAQADKLPKAGPAVWPQGFPKGDRNGQTSAASAPSVVLSRPRKRSLHNSANRGHPPETPPSSGTANVRNEPLRGFVSFGS